MFIGQQNILQIHFWLAVYNVKLHAQTFGFTVLYAVLYEL